MWALISALVALLGVVVWYYRNKLSQTVQLDGLVKANTQALYDLNSLIATLTANANKAGEKDLEDAKNVKTASDAADFLNHSVSHPAAATGTLTGLHTP